MSDNTQGRHGSRKHNGDRTIHDVVNAVVRRRRENKIHDAQVRQTLADSRTPQEQLRRLDQRLGKDIGAKKERTRLRTKIDEKK